MRDVLIPLIERIRRRTGGTVRMTRRTGADDTDLWGVIVETDIGTFAANDYDTPGQAARTVLADYTDAQQTRERPA